VNSYPWKAIDPKDYLHIEAQKNLTFQDVHVLTKLYQPLIGSAAYSLYLSLFADVDFQAQTNERTISKLLTKLDTGIPDFYHARVRLEGIGLLRVYRAKEEPRDYYYEMQPPLSAEAFFKDSLLRTLLVEKIGDRLFQEEMDGLLAQMKDKEAYEETTRSFLDVYHFDVQNKDVLSDTDFMPIDTNKPPKIAESIENVETFDYEFFKKGLDKHFIKRDSLSEEIKELIYTFHIVYGIDELTMQSLILESADVESGQVNKNKFIQYVQRNYQNKQKNKRPASEPTPTEETSDLEKEGFSGSETSVINHAKETAPANYLGSIKEQKGGFVTSNETWVLKELVEQSPLNKEVINILLHYILVIKEGVVLEKNYAMTIANDWAQSGIKTAEDAIGKVKTIYTQPRKPKNRKSNNYRNYNKSKRKEPLPEWAKKETQEKKAEQHGQAEQPEDEPVSQKNTNSNSVEKRLERLRQLREQKEDN